MFRWHGNTTEPLDVPLRLPGTYAAKIDKIRPTLHVSLNNSVTRPYLNGSGKGREGQGPWKALHL